MSNRIQLHRKSTGFTLVELLVSITIIGTLMALVLPAIQKARESSRLMSCQNKLRQIGVAFIGHHDQFKAFPSGGWDWFEPPTYKDGISQTGNEQRAGWGYQILPFIEAVSTWNGGAGKTELDQILISIGTTNPIFFCPSRRPPQFVTYSDIDYLGGISVKHALCDYAGCNLEDTGVVKRYTQSTMQAITDGTSNTMLVGEKRMNLATLGEIQSDDNEGYTAGWDEDTMRSTSKTPGPDTRTEDSGKKAFGSSHAGVFNAVFADGAIHTIVYTIDPTVFERLGDMSDEESLGDTTP